jgi:hypothetical protein
MCFPLSDFVHPVLGKQKLAPAPVTVGIDPPAPLARVAGRSDLVRAAEATPFQKLNPKVT